MFPASLYVNRCARNNMQYFYLVCIFTCHHPSSLSTLFLPPPCHPYWNLHSHSLLFIYVWYYILWYRTKLLSFYFAVISFGKSRSGACSAKMCKNIPDNPDYFCQEFFSILKILQYISDPSVLSVKKRYIILFILLLHMCLLSVQWRKKSRHTLVSAKW